MSLASSELEFRASSCCRIGLVLGDFGDLHQGAALVQHFWEKVLDVFWKDGSLFE